MRAWRITLQIGGFVSTALLIGLSSFIFLKPTLGLKVLWLVAVPIAPLVFFLAPNLWMSICPFAFIQSVPRLLGVGGKYVIPRFIHEKLEYLAWLLLFLLVPLRPLIFNQNETAAIAAIVGISLAALISGFVFSGMSGWCNSLCPVRPVELLYGQFSKYTKNPAQCMPCSGCAHNCSRLRNSNWTRNHNHTRIAYSFPGFVWGYFVIATNSSIVETYIIMASAMLVSYFIFLALTKLMSSSTLLKTIAMVSLVIYYSHILFIASREWSLDILYITALYVSVGLLLSAGFLIFTHNSNDTDLSSTHVRRRLLKTAITGLATLVGLSPWVLAKAGRKAQDQLVRLGSKSKYRGAVAYLLGARKNRTSLLTELHLDSGFTRTLVLPLHEGHSTLITQSGLLACIGHHSPDMVVVDSDMHFIKKISAPNGHTYGGHGVVLEDGRTVISTPIAHAQTPKDHGLLQIYDQHMNLVDEVSSGGVQPHEVHFVNNRKEIAVTHYGELWAKRENWPYTLNVMEPKLTILDAQTLRPVRDYLSKVDWAILSHFDVGLDGQVYAVSNNYWIPTKENIQGYRKHIHQFGDANYDLVEAEHGSGIAMPLPLLIIDPLTGEQKVIDMPSNKQRRSQSVRTNQHNGYVFATYVYSNSLIVFPPGKEPFSFNCGTWDVEFVRGIDQIKGTPYMVISGSKNRIVVFNSETMKPIQSHNLIYGRALHLDVNPNPLYA